MENASPAWDMAFHAVPFRAGDRVITARVEYLSNYLAFLRMKARVGIEIDVVDSDASGQLDLAALERAIGPRTKLIAITHVPGRAGSSIGGRRRPHRHAPRHPLSAPCLPGDRPARGRCAADRLPHALGHEPQVSARAPRHPPPLRAAIHREARAAVHRSPAASWIDVDTYVVRDDARRFENWERFITGQISLGVAARYSMRVGLDAIEAPVKALATLLRR